MRLSIRTFGFVVLLAGIMPSVRADATVRYHTDVQTSALIPAGTLDQALSGLKDMVIRIKGNRAYSLQGPLVSIMDLTTQDLTFVDASKKHFAKVPAGGYAQMLKNAVPAVPEQARAALASMKSNLESRDTGRTAAIQGIQAEEHEFVLTIEMASPGVPGLSGPFMKMVMQMWTAKPEEAERVPALQEFRSYTTSAGAGMNPGEMMKQVLTAMPGIGNSLSAMVEEMTKKSAMTLRTHMELSMPFLAAMSQQMPAGTLPAGLDPNAPVIQMSQELAELSTSPVDDALFVIPADYQQTSVEEILKGAASAPPPPQFKQ